jgi:hypothetical protein
MKTLHIFLIGALLLLLSSCESLLNQMPQGVVSSADLNSPERVEQLVIAAYSYCGQNNSQSGKQFGVPYNEGSVRGGEAYKGGSGTSDYGEIDLWEQFVYMQPTTAGELDWLWYSRYVAVGRVHDALRRANAMTDAEYPKRMERIAELRFLRAHCYFYMKECFKFFPYIDENTDETLYDKISNDVYTNVELWDKIAEDFRFAAEHLPETQIDEVGRPTKYAAEAYLAKTLLFAAYEQDESHNVTNINREKLTEVAALCKDVMDRSGKSLYGDFGLNFLCEYENGQESIWAIQFSANNDNSPIGRNNSWDIYPMNSDYGCCGFFCPSTNMMNTFKTVNGLPDMDNYNTGIMMDNKEAFTTTPCDPRLMHSAIVPGMPWKYDPTYIMQDGWARTPEVYGRSMSQKMLVLPTCDCFRKANPYMGSGLNWDVIRMDEVMLWRAEALIQLGEAAGLTEALSLINQIRERAGRSIGMLTFEDGSPTGQFSVATYQPGVNCPAWDQAFALKALKFERRLEFATEGKWFFDLVRWGEAAEFCNAYFDVERTRRSYMAAAKFTKGRDEYFPVPQIQINYVKGLYKQNNKW